MTLNKKYKKNYLTSIIFRIDFDDIKIKEDEIEKLKDKIGLEFFNIKDTPVNIVKINNNKTEKNKIEEKIIRNYIFADSKQENKLIIIKNSFIFETTKYKNFEVFKNNFEKVLNNFLYKYEIQNIKRIGLRYVNQIEIENIKEFSDWEKYINKTLVQQINSFSDEELMLARNMNTMFLKRKDDSLIKFIYGIYNSTFPLPAKKNVFLLDYDCYETNIEKFEIINKINEYHDSIKNLFEKSIKNNLRKKMEIENE